MLPFPCLLLEPAEEVFRIVHANKKYCQLSGKNPAELKGQQYPQLSYKEHLPEQNLQRKRLSLQKAFISGEPNKTECLRFDLHTLQKGEKSIRFWEVENIPVKDEDGKVNLILSRAKDQTLEVQERQKSEEKLDENRKQQDYFIKKNPDGLYSLDRQGNFTSLNEGLAKLAEMPEEELINHSFLPFCAPKDRERTLECFQKAVQGESQVFE